MRADAQIGKGAKQSRERIYQMNKQTNPSALERLTTNYCLLLLVPVELPSLNVSDNGTCEALRDCSLAAGLDTVRDNGERKV